MEPSPATEATVDSTVPATLGIKVTETVGGVEVIDRIAPAWRELCADPANCDQPFYRPEFVRANIQAFAPKARVFLLTATMGGKLKAVLPLISRIGWFCGLPARQLESASNVHSCRFDMVRAAGPDGDAAVEAIWKHLSKSRTWDLILLTTVPEKGSLRRMAALAEGDGCHLKEWETCSYPYVPLTGDGDEPWMSELSGQFRRLIRRRTRQLEDEGTLRLVRTETADPEALQRFYKAESSGWKGKEGSAITCRADTRAFYDEIAHSAALHGYFSLYVLHLNDNVVGGGFGFDYNGRHLFLKAAYNEAYKTRAPGHVLIEKVLRDCKQRGLVEFDFAGPTEEYKLKWTSLVRPLYQYCIFRNSSYSRLLYALRIQGARSVKRLITRKKSR